MKHSVIENPFAPEKQRSSDDSAFVGKILGAEAEAAMRKAVGKTEVQEPEPATDLDLTDAEHVRAEQERRERSSEWKMEHARKELCAWAEEIGKDADWALETFTIHTDGTLTVEGDLDLTHLPVTHLPKGLREVGGILGLGMTKIISIEGFPEKVGGDVDLTGVQIISLKGFPQTIGGNIFLADTRIKSLHGLPKKIEKDLHLSRTDIASLRGLPQNIGGSLYLDGVTTLMSLDGLPERIPGDLSLYWSLVSSLHGLSKEIGGDLDLRGTSITSLDGLPLPENIGGKVLLFTQQQDALISVVGKDDDYYGIYDIDDKTDVERTDDERTREEANKPEDRLY
ncbi:MAG: hypothetical protein Q7S16_01775 [bacterium]|nr:hypothetical protein [bacterium]MDO8581579.1 hypothetical protein [bacterium]